MTAIRDEKLKPCPFCGSEPFLHQMHVQKTGEDLEMFTVICTNCHAGVYVPKEEAIAAWNRRSTIGGGNE